MRYLIALAALAGCFSPGYRSGGLVCGNGSQPCPDGYHCAVDHFCWKNGEDPDLATAADLSNLRDLAPPPPDLAADLSTPATLGDMAPLPADFAGFDGHAVQAICAGGGGVKAAGSAHSVTLSVGQKTSGVAAGTAHRVQLGVLRGTQAK